jgi:hypothetical protein
MVTGGRKVLFHYIRHYTRTALHNRVQWKKRSKQVIRDQAIR